MKSCNILGAKGLRGFYGSFKNYLGKDPTCSFFTLPNPSLFF
jgi:hypothetical protein